MENRKIIIILAVILIVMAAAVAMLFMNNSNQPVIYANTIPGVGTFNSTNVTNFTYSSSDNPYQTDYLANDSIAQVSVCTSSAAVEISISEADKVNDSAEGHTIYKNTANVGEHKGEVRYFSILKDQDNSRYILISTADYNLTCMIVDSFKFLDPV